VKETLMWGFIMNYFGRKPIDKKHSDSEGLIPKFERHGSMSKQRQPNFYYVTMFSLGKSILLVSMRA
jgi:hypothetical protein